MENVMRFALVDNLRCEASPGLIGCCPGCSKPTIAKCGTQKVWHWAHRGKRNCDPWWEPETPWHRSWKDQFPSGWQEVIRRDEAGEKHIADVSTENGLVIEFQHSHLPSKERAAREAFHRNMVWVVDGTRLKRDHPRFLQGQRLCRPTSLKGLFITCSPEECFPAAWLNCTMPVFFDFEGMGTSDEISGTIRSRLWCLLPGRAEGQAIVAALSRRAFIHAAREKAQIIPGRAIVEMIAARLKRERAVAELSARRRFYAHPPHQKRSSRPFRRRRRSRY
ncbi:MAG: competence protein [Mesorhizobium sp.]|uniref:competence protein CoiA n=4 Tax=Mesorhizobium TaxID=68287 RepID=UPI000FE92B49|nr:competence protein CoiA family protein [Mesorhizobium sp. P13.3]RWG23632.1 MAG: competence protein [Mesorhizobium sp.]RWG37810.1 MAG: competence protein [Mesorhizobium sp.]RWG48174.1 MAG: competence protein [Mesorhizobium sp.]RWG55087.1 MAG: competence protein [Mesorhizobium sp.]RWG67836.1 MAG: competence protein [Mesorhizobium sp.]